MEPPSGALPSRSPSSPPPPPREEAAPSSPSPPWARLSAWLECACAVTFDLELGQAIELVYPPEPALSEKEKTSICYLAFPDSYSGSLGDTQYCFRFRQSGSRLRERPWAQSATACRKEAPAALQETAHYFGYVYFRQVRDSSVKRGYFQKSLVLVSRLPYVNLFQSLLQLIAPEYFDKLEPCLEAVCSEIDQWPPPVPGQTLNLPVMGVVIQVRIPSKVERPDASPVLPLKQENLLPAPLLLPSACEVDLFR
nr:protein DENND6B-like isoform X2 [Anolis sagrei ordinatus]